MLKKHTQILTSAFLLILLSSTYAFAQGEIGFRIPVYASEDQLKEYFEYRVDSTQTTPDQDYVEYPGMGQVCEEEELFYQLPNLRNFSYSFDNVNWQSVVQLTMTDFSNPNQESTWDIPDAIGESLYLKFVLLAPNQALEIIELGPFEIVDCYQGEIFPSKGTSTTTTMSPLFNVVSKTDLEENTNEQLKVQIGPNPIINDLNIHYTIGKEERVDIHLYDLTGRLVEVIQEDANTLAGIHNIRYDMRDLVEGLYIVKLKMGETNKAFRVYKTS